MRICDSQPRAAPLAPPCRDQAGDHIGCFVSVGLFRNLGNMNNPALFTHCNVGTKRLVERYTEEVVRQLEFIANEDIHGVSLADKIGTY
jgi:hypothetical protein